MNNSLIHRRAIVCAVGLSLGAAVGACRDKKLGPDVPASVALISGDSQSILAGDRASAPLVAQINNSDGAPLPNVPVRWAVVTGGGSLETLVDTTNANGQASTTYLSPAIAGKATVSAAAAGQSRGFTLLIASDTVGTLSAYSGDGAAALVGFQLTLVAKASDRFGNPMKGVDVAWSSSDGLLQLSSGVTDSVGNAKNIITVGPDTGRVSIVASSRFNAVTFTVTALHGN